MALTDYSQLESEINSAEAPQVIPKGTEVKARIIGHRDGISEKDDYDGCKWHSVSFDVPDIPNAKEFNDFMWELDKDKLPAKAFTRELFHFQTFAAAFGIDLTRPFDWDDLVGKEGWIIVGTKKSDDYGEQNTVSKYSSGR